MKDPFTAPLTHSGRSYLSGMTCKPSIDISSYTGKVTVLPLKGEKRRLRTKSHMVSVGYARGGNKMNTGKIV
jgi:hypothetical protein